MDYKYSKTTNAFYVDSIHGDTIPKDAVTVPGARHKELMNGQAKGKLIRPDDNGNPILQDPPPPTPEQMQAAKNAAARKYLTETDWYVIRHAETGEPIPSDVAEKRAEARASVVE